MEPRTLTSPEARSLLTAAGFAVPEGPLDLRPREARQVAFLPGGLLAWFASDADGLARLTRERLVLRVLEARCRFLAPRVLYEAPGGVFDVRRAVPGASGDPFGVFHRARADHTLARAIGAAVGEFLAEQHTRVTRADVEGAVPDTLDWPEEGVRERARRVTDDRDLLRAIDRVMDRYDALVITPEERALVHGDVGFHNLAFDPTTLTPTGIFDYEGAAWADRHQDLRYLLFDEDREDLLDAALAVYEPLVGVRVCRARVALYNAACAASFLAYREGVAPEADSCGRTLAQDLRWTRHAAARALSVSAQ